jgi:RNA polymerase sigma factor (sigma-70 family)
VAGHADEGHERSVHVENWELELARKIAGSFKKTIGDDAEELEAELFQRLLEIKLQKLEGIEKWASFLAKSLFNAANNFLNKRNYRRDRMESFDAIVWEEDDNNSIPLGNMLEEPIPDVDFKIQLDDALKTLSPELKELWKILIEEEGNTSKVAERLGRPRKTVEYWIDKIKAILKKKAPPEK